MHRVRTIFFGSGEFAVPIIKKLLDLDYLHVTAVITQKDKPTGRKQKLTPVPVKKLLTQNFPKLKLYTPSKYRDAETDILSNEKPELIIVADYGQILPKITIEYPKYKCLNVHGSILPDLRGAVPIPIAILEGYEKTGVSIPIMTSGLDDGPVLGSVKVGIDKTDTTESLKFKLAAKGSDYLADLLPKWINGKIEAVEQHHEFATVADKSLIDKSKARITFQTDSARAERMIRAFYPWPVAWCFVNINNKVLRLKIFKAAIQILNNANNAGIISKENKKLYLNLADGRLELVDLQLEGKKRGKGVDYLYLDGKRIV